MIELNRALYPVEDYTQSQRLAGIFEAGFEITAAEKFETSERQKAEKDAVTAWKAALETELG
jgi:hypothetical protein